MSLPHPEYYALRNLKRATFPSQLTIKSMAVRKHIASIPDNEHFPPFHSYYKPNKNGKVCIPQTTTGWPAIAIKHTQSREPSTQKQYPNLAFITVLQLFHPIMATRSHHPTLFTYPTQCTFRFRSESSCQFSIWSVNRKVDDIKMLSHMDPFRIFRSLAVSWATASTSISTS